jgi:hypothetical protein
MYCASINETGSVLFPQDIVGLGALATHLETTPRAGTRLQIQVQRHRLLAIRQGVGAGLVVSIATATSTAEELHQPALYRYLFLEGGERGGMTRCGDGIYNGRRQRRFGLRSVRESPTKLSQSRQAREWLASTWRGRCRSAMHIARSVAQRCGSALMPYRPT